MKMTKHSISESPSSYARIRVKRAGLKCDADIKNFKVIGNEMEKYMVSSTLRQAESMQLINKVLKSDGQFKLVRKTEKDLIEHIKRKNETFTAIAQENDKLEELSEW
jgi:hypothetical protein